MSSAVAKRGRTPKPGLDRPEIVAAICLAVSGGQLVKVACKAAGISRDTLHQWTQEDRELADLYARARSNQAHAIAEEALEIADQKADTSEAVARNRLRVDTRKWMASKIAPKLFGDRLELAGDASAPLSVKVVFSNE